jgi:cyclopropane-fatty-acyl-phospholipid synthase
MTATTHPIGPEMRQPAPAADHAVRLPADRRLRLCLRLAEMITVGQITLIMPDGQTYRVFRTETPAATMHILEPRAVTRLATGGSLGLAEAYIDGLWDSPDVRGVMQLAGANDAEWEQMLLGRPWIRAISRLLHHLRPNTRRGARRNITDHYDLGNGFYSAWLDPGMTYSAALFEEPGEDLRAAQERKLHRLCQVLKLAPGMRVLEIGCGWGSFAEIAARDYGASVVAITLSERQREYAQARIAAAGLGDRVEIRLQDYRDTDQQFDRVASIEMFEAVGEKFWPAYFKVVRDRLKAGGLAGLQVITIADRLFPDYRSKADFIQRHIFPGGMLPSPTRLREEVARAGLKWLADHWFGQDYAETLLRWQTAFQSRWPTIMRGPGGFDTRFKRVWEYYLAYCETGFRTGWTDVGQFVLLRPA